MKVAKIGFRIFRLTGKVENLDDITGNGIFEVRGFRRPMSIKCTSQYSEDRFCDEIGESFTRADGRCYVEIGRFMECDEDENGKIDYHMYDKEYIGSSDGAALTVTGGDKEIGLVSKILKFIEDGSYCAYIVDENAVIGDHYEKVMTFNYFIRIYDDDSLVAKFDGDVINIYRARDFGCIIQILNKEQS